LPSEINGPGIPVRTYEGRWAKEKEKQSMYRILSITGIILLLIILVPVACEPAGFLLSEEGNIECGGDGEAIILNNNPEATDPTYDELVEFIKNDSTDTKDYIEEGPDAYVCSDFAEEVHNNAEAAGIRAGWVGVTFQGIDEGHALNAFETIDRGLVYVDCTKGSDSGGGDNEAQSWDTVAYIEIGKRYGIIHIDRAKSLLYDFYVEYEKAWQEHKELLKSYNEEVERFNDEVGQKVYTVGSPEEQFITAWKKEILEKQEILENQKKQLGDYWYESEFSSYTVKNVRIHW
jgi:hypothetical protein